MKGVRAVAINVDAWLNLPNDRFDASNPAEHYYHNAIRFEEMFAQTILPLRDHRSLSVVINYADETSLVVQTGDSEERRFGPGQVLLLDDTTGEGHLSTFSHDEPCKCLVVQIGD